MLGFFFRVWESLPPKHIVITMFPHTDTPKNLSKTKQSINNMADWFELLTSDQPANPAPAAANNAITEARIVKLWTRLKEVRAADVAEEILMTIYPEVEQPTPLDEGKILPTAMTTAQIRDLAAKLKQLPGRVVSMIFAYGETTASPLSPICTWDGRITTKTDAESGNVIIRWSVPQGEDENCGITEPEAALPFPYDKMTDAAGTRTFHLFYVSVSKRPPTKKAMSDLIAKDGAKTLKKKTGRETSQEANADSSTPTKRPRPTGFKEAWEEEQPVAEANADYGRGITKRRVKFNLNAPLSPTTEFVLVPMTAVGADTRIDFTCIYNYIDIEADGTNLQEKWAQDYAVFYLASGMMTGLDHEKNMKLRACAERMTRAMALTRRPSSKNDWFLFYEILFDIIGLLALSRGNKEEDAIKECRLAWLAGALDVYTKVTALIEIPPKAPQAPRVDPPRTEPPRTAAAAEAEIPSRMLQRLATIENILARGRGGGGGGGRNRGRGGGG